MPRGQFDGLRLDLANGERVHVYGRPELWEQKGELRLRALSIERFGIGEHLAALERLKAKLAAEGLFAETRKRPLPRLPRRIGLVTGNDAAAKRDVLTAIQARFPPARVVVAETLVQGPRAAAGDRARRCAQSPPSRRSTSSSSPAAAGASRTSSRSSDERVVRAVAECPVPVVTAVGHEQDTPLCDLAADRRASTPTAAGRLVVPDLEELARRPRPRARRARAAARAGTSSATGSGSPTRTTGSAARPRSSSSAGAPGSTSRPRASARSRRARRSSAATRSSAAATSSSASAATVSPGDALAIELADGTFGARAE